MGSKCTIISTLPAYSWDVISCIRRPQFQSKGSPVTCIYHTCRWAYDVCHYLHFFLDFIMKVFIDYKRASASGNANVTEGSPLCPQLLWEGTEGHTPSVQINAWTRNASDVAAQPRGGPREGDGEPGCGERGSFSENNSFLMVTR